MKSYAIIICSVLLMACSESTKEPAQNEIYRIVFARASTCWPSPYEAVSVDTSFLLQYHGVAFVDTYGYHEGRITAGTWETIKYKCAPVLKLKSDSCWNTSDAEEMELIVYSSSGVQHFRGEHNCLDDSLLMLCNWLMRVKDNTTLTETKQFSLETNAQKSYDGLPRDPNLAYDTVIIGQINLPDDNQ